MRKPLTLGTARIEQQPTYWLLTYMNIGSFLVCERPFAWKGEAIRFCRERGLEVIEITTA